MGVLVCGTGLGVCIAANKIHGVRAVDAWNVEAARLSRAHNDANVFCVGARLVAGGEAFAVVDAWLDDVIRRWAARAPGRQDHGARGRRGTTTRADRDTDGTTEATGATEQRMASRTRRPCTRPTSSDRASGTTTCAAACSAPARWRRWSRKGVRGLTSNPTIFEKAIVASSDYEEALRKLVAEGRSTIGDLRGARDRGHPRRLRPAAAGVSRRAAASTGASRWRCCPSWRPTPSRRSRKGCASRKAGRAPQRHDQGPGHARGDPGHPRADGRRASASTSR